jgi:hypothetical protein
MLFEGDESQQSRGPKIGCSGRHGYIQAGAPGCVDQQVTSNDFGYFEDELPKRIAGNGFDGF